MKKIPSLQSPSTSMKNKNSGEPQIVLISIDETV